MSNVQGVFRLRKKFERPKSFLFELILTSIFFVDKKHDIVDFHMCEGEKKNFGKVKYKNGEVCASPAPL